VGRAQSIPRLKDLGLDARDGGRQGRLPGACLGEAPVKAGCETGTTEIDRDRPHLLPLPTHRIVRSSLLDWADAPKQGSEGAPERGWRSSLPFGRGWMGSGRWGSGGPPGGEVLCVSSAGQEAAAPTASTSSAKLHAARSRSETVPAESGASGGRGERCQVLSSGPRDRQARGSPGEGAGHVARGGVGPWGGLGWRAVSTRP